MQEGGGSKPSPIKPPVRKVSTKPPAKSQVKPPVKTQPLSPSRPKSPRVVQGTGLNPRMATRIVDENYGGNVQKAWHSYAPGAIRDFMKQGMSFAEARQEARDEFGFDIKDATSTGPTLWSGFNWNPDYSAEPEPSSGGGGGKKYYGGGGGGGGYAPPPPVPPEMKIRTTAGIRRSPYWQSEDPYQQEFEPRFVVLGNQQAW